MRFHVKESDLSLMDILDIFEELNIFVKNYIERMVDLDKKEIALVNLYKIQVSIAEKMCDYFNVPEGIQIAFKELDNHAFVKEIFLLFFQGYLSKKEIEYFLEYISKESLSVHY